MALLPKPEGCKGCPAYGDGLGFVPDDVIDGAVTTVILQNPGPDEEAGRKVVAMDQKNRPVYQVCDHKPAIGRTGYFMDRTLLPLAGLERGKNVSVLNVLKCRWTDNGRKVNELPRGKVLLDIVDRCTCAYLRIPASTRLVVAAGQLAWEYLQGDKLSISSWRGFVGPKLLTLDSALSPKSSETKPVLNSGGCSTAAETSGHATTVQVPVLATLHPADLFRERRMILPSRSDWKKVPKLLEGTWPTPLPTRLVISAHTTIREIDEWFGHAYEKAQEVSIDTEYVPEKELLTIIGIGFRDGHTISGCQLEWLNQDISRIIRSRFVQGLRHLLTTRKAIFWNAQADLPILQKNLSIRPPLFEDAMLAHAALWSELPHDLDFASSVYSPYNKPKKDVVGWGLDKNWGDVVATVCVWESIATSLQGDPGARDDYYKQKLPLVSILLENQQHGLRVNKDRVTSMVPMYEERLRQASRIAQAACGWPVNLGSSTQLAYWLYSHGGLDAQYNRKTKKETVDDDAIAELRNKIEPAPDFTDEKSGVNADYIRDRIAQGANPLLEGRVLYAESKQILSHYLTPLVLDSGGVCDRVYPETSTHTQDNGRWSISRPPLAQLPDDLRDIIVPDPGFVHVHWDWNAAEPWIQALTMKSRFLTDALGNGWDLNTLALCDLMGWMYPYDRSNPMDDKGWTTLHQWEGKDDPRRRLAKAGRLALDYGKLDLSTLPGVARLGLVKADLKTAGQRIIDSDPDKRRYMAATLGRVRKGENISRDWTGARRVFLGTVGDSMYREWLNHPFQRGVASLLNLTVAEIVNTVPGVRYAWSMHDAGDISCPVEQLSTALPAIRTIVEQERDINGTKHAFKATWSVVYDDGRRESIA